jgi:hypothetical protein
MPGNEPTSESNLDGYGAPRIEWMRVRAVLDGEITQAPGTGGPGRHTAWLTTSNPAEFSAPAAGPPPWHVYRLVPSTVFALGTAEPYGATRFDLASAVAG